MGLFYFMGRFDKYDLLTFIGAGLIVAGVCLIYLPAAFIVAGVFVILAGLLGASQNNGGGD